jgi:competence protein ComEA
MESASPLSAPRTSKPEQPVVLTAWPRSAQLALAFFLGLATALIAVHAYSCSRWGSRPTELERGPGLSYRIDLNHAERPELLQIPGIGEALAQRIEEHRRAHGAFRSVDELTLVRGIGPATLDRVRSWVQVSPIANADAAESAEPAGKRPLSQKAVATPRSLGGRKTGSKKEAGLTEPIDINRATAVELQRLAGIGPKISQRIVEERRKGPFKSVEDLRRVQGIGPKTLERLRAYVTVQGELTRLATTN